MKVSVIVPAYNCQDYILSCLNSLLNQDFKDSYEIVVVDDASTDNTLNLIKNLDPKIRVFSHSKNRGAAIARNTGVINARGKIVIFQDADDIAIPQKLKLLTTLLEQNRNNIVAVGGKAELITSDQKFSLNEALNNEIYNNPLKILFRQYHPLLPMTTLATYKNLALKCQIKNSFFKVAEDYYFQLKLAQYGSFFKLNIPITFCNKRQGSLTDKYRTIYQMAYSLCAVYDFYNQIPLSYKRRYENIFKIRVRHDLPFVFPAALLGKDLYLLFYLLKILIFNFTYLDKAFLKRIYWGYTCFKQDYAKK